jgi:hypothetical protein
MSSVRPAYIQGWCPPCGRQLLPAGLEGGRRYIHGSSTFLMEHPKFSILSNVENNDDTSGVKNPTQKKIKPSKGPILATQFQTLFFGPPFFFNYIFKKGAWIKKKRKIVKGKIGN